MKTKDALQRLREIFTEENLDDLPGQLELEALFTEAGYAFRTLDAELPIDVDLSPVIEALREGDTVSVEAHHPLPRSFHPDDAFEPVGAAELLASGVISQELHDLFTDPDPDAQPPTKVTFVPITPGLTGPFWWLSFADPNLPEGSQFLGCAVVEAPDFILAVQEAHWRKCNPGGECQGLGPFPAALAAKLRPEDIHTLLTREQSKALDARLLADD